MMIKRFLAKKIHGYMDFDIKFNKDMTFLTGINGSGKTTVVRCLSAVLYPSLLVLAYTNYEKMSVELEQDKKIIKIETTKTNGQIYLRTSIAEDTLEVKIFPEDVDEYTSSVGMRDKEIEYYRVFIAENASHPVIKTINELPSPMLLGIERRGLELNPPRYRRLFYPRQSQKTKNIFGASIYSSLVEASALAADAWKQMQTDQFTCMERLRSNILLSAIKYTDVLREERSLPKSQDIAAVASQRDIIIDTLQQLGLATADVRHELDPFLKKLENVHKALGHIDKIDEIFERRKLVELNAYGEWITNYPQFQRIFKIVEHAKQYITESEQIRGPVNRYLRIVNSFLKDSHKEIYFDPIGYLNVRIKGTEPVPITSLSSGESQIIVIITHLCFNPDAQRANVFIIDEPELSLHVAWQELFVSAVRDANPKLQLIVATHSPFIILDNQNKCVDLSKIK